VDPNVVAVSDRAADNLRFIRETMERASSFTAVPGWGGIAMGVTALGAAYLAAQQGSAAGWLRIWMIELVVALAAGGIAMFIKARRTRTSLHTGPARRFAFTFAPPVVAGGILTWVLATRSLHELLPTVWLMLYGSGVIAGGMASVRIVPIMGLGAFALGVAALFGAGDWMLALGFGVLHIVFGAIIAWRYGG
jgi:hypothetical protein